MTAKNTREICIHARLEVAAKDLLPLAKNARNFAELLIERNLWQDAVAYMSHAITPREAIWWAWFCARKAALPKSNPTELKALSLAEAWIGQPTEDNRKVAKAEAERIPAGTAPHSILMAIQHTGEFENEVTGEKSPALPYVSNKFVIGAVTAAIYEINREKPELVAVEFLKQSLEVADRIQLWARYA